MRSVLRGGLELRLNEVVALRAGYDDAYDAGSGLTMGAGILIKDFELGFFPLKRVTLDYAYRPSDDLEALHYITIGARVATQ